MSVDGWMGGERVGSEHGMGQRGVAHLDFHSSSHAPVAFAFSFRHVQNLEYAAYVIAVEPSPWGEYRNLRDFWA